MENYLFVSGVDLSPYIKTMDIDDEPVWNTDAGRTIDATFVGRVVARKWKLNFSTIPLTQKQSAMIHSALKIGDFVQAKFVPPTATNDTFLTKTFYVSPTSNKVFSYNDKLVRYETMTFNLIEQ